MHQSFVNVDHHIYKFHCTLMSLPKAHKCAMCRLSFGFCTLFRTTCKLSIFIIVLSIFIIFLSTFSIFMSTFIIALSVFINFQSTCVIVWSIVNIYHFVVYFYYLFVNVYHLFVNVHHMFIICLSMLSYVCQCYHLFVNVIFVYKSSVPHQRLVLRIDLSTNSTNVQINMSGHHLLLTLGHFCESLTCLELHD